ncbi:MAG: polymer-forming cytoskeletal protein [Nitrospirota bacterium]|nr:polymer-forming cytoskeletal protein [Nitrospirota bacterium]
MRQTANESGKGNIIAFLGKETLFKGYLQFEGTVRIDGVLEGEIHSNNTLIIGDGASINGTINVGRVVCGGTVNGKIIANESIQLVKPSNVKGEIKTPILLIEEGVIFNGQCEMGTGVRKEDDKIKDGIV